MPLSEFGFKNKQDVILVKFVRDNPMNALHNLYSDSSSEC